ncbi:MAG: U32 family peptidase [Lachnospiraceae bacterium]|nr:U32 family peptidase [Lachnospiraceae bacterium]
MGKCKTELLAPAGNYESFLGAIAAGADAVYLAGTKYGARAYADNFTEEEICEAISYAHIFGRKVYLTVNTLLKDEELEELPVYLTPYYLAGLDGVIIQDMGVLLTIKEHFPHLALHASTQMSLTGSAGAGMLKELGVVRIVPARELSLQEIQRIKKESGVEIESFIHGAMCYSYSGQCLFSSILGGRSGNRGRCAQPCRLPYRIGKADEEGGECYPLSLKDMCTVDVLPALMEAGINSFKIEGRMKKPEYAAGVTAIYRKYIDMYEQNGKAGYQVERTDRDKLSSLYIRSNMQEGYYFKKNGKDMVTLQSPSYNGSDEKLLQEIRKLYLDKPLKKKIKLYAEFTVGKNAILILEAPNDKGEVHQVRVEGMPVEAAMKQPVSEENIKTALLKLGNTPFMAEVGDLELTVTGDVFYPLKALNELRREGVRELIKTFDPYGRKLSDIMDAAAISNDANGYIENNMLTRMVNYKSTKSQTIEGVRILISSKEQLLALKEAALKPQMIYIESELAQEKYVYISELKSYGDNTEHPCKVYLALPYIVRSADTDSLRPLLPIIREADGCLVRNLETYAWLRGIAYEGEIALDAGLYCFNKKSLDFWRERVHSICLPYELNERELNLLTQDVLRLEECSSLEQTVYGRLPLMVTANCIAKTADTCQKSFHDQTCYYLKDRYHKIFPVTIHCRYCYNVLYNSLPLSLHEKIIKAKMPFFMRLNFSVEDYDQTAEVLAFFEKLLQGNRAEPPYREYTKGHEKRGVE